MPDTTEAQDEQTGFDAFPAARWMDAVRGTKTYPDHARCPFRRPDRKAAWQRGYDRAADACLGSVDELA